MTTDVERTEWSPPGAVDVPRDTLKMQLEVYGETILLRGLEGGTNWVRTVSSDEIANVFIQHLGFSSGLLPKETLWWNQGETGQVVALWRPPQVWPVALQREAFKPPARLRLPMPGLVFVCSPARAPWVYAALEQADRLRADALQDARLQRLQGRAGLPRKPQVPGGGRTHTGVLLPVLLLGHRGQQASGQRNTPTTCTPYGRSLMERLITRLRTLFPSARWPRSIAASQGRRLGYR